MTRRTGRSADFERALAAPSRRRTAHFALHYAPQSPTSRRPVELSTGDVTDGRPAVDDGLGLGLAIPKRHARRAATRSLLKRLARAAVEQRRGQLEPGFWVVRLRAGFDRRAFPSAVSDALRAAARSELAELFEPSASAAPRSRT